MAQAVLDFWFAELSPQQWFNGGKAVDQLIAQRFSTTLAQAAAGELHAWRESAEGRLAEIIVLDQFSRNVYRGSAQAFAQDAMALALAQEAVRQGALAQLAKVEQRAFLLMPYMHSESRAIHAIAAPLFQQYADANSYDFELKHKAIVDEFGRYPHRNAVLGRVSSAAEEAFLQQPGSSF